MSERVDVEAIVTASRSDVGKTRSENQDSCGDFLHLAGARLLILADGMGGHKGGRLASRTCVDAFARIFEEQAGSPEQQLRAAFALANEEIYNIALEDQELVGMGTTGVALLVTADGCALVGWVGDSRAYRWRDGALEQLTEDHSLVSEWVRMGVLSPEQAEIHPRRSELTRAVGVQPDVDPQLRALDSRPGDRFLLCSDGLFGLVEDGEIAAIVAGQEPVDAVRALVDHANAAGGTDNVSVQIAVLPDTRAAAEPSASEAPADATPPAPVSAPPPLDAAFDSPAEGSVRRPPPAPEVVIAESRSFHAPSALVGAAIVVVLLTAGYVGLTELGARRLSDVLLEAGRRVVPQATPSHGDAPENESDPLEASRDAPPKEAPGAGSEAAEPRGETPAIERPEVGPEEPGDPEPAERDPGARADSAPAAREPPIEDTAHAPAQEGAPESEPLAPSEATLPGEPPDPADSPSPQPSGERPQTSGDGPQPSGERPQTSGEGPQTSGDGPQTSGEGPQTSGQGSQTSGEGPQTSGEGPQTSGEGPQTSGEGPRTSGESPQTSGEPGDLEPELTASSAGGEPYDPGGSLPLARESAPAPEEIPDTAAFDLTPRLRLFLDAWLRAAATRDFALYHELGFPDSPDLFARTYARWEGFRIEAIDVEDERGGPGVRFVRVTLSYVFENESGRWRTEDEHRLILRETADGLRYEARWK